MGERRGSGPQHRPGTPPSGRHLAVRAPDIADSVRQGRSPGPKRTIAARSRQPSNPALMAVAQRVARACLAAIGKRPAAGMPLAWSHIFH
jgi:hypothetical protein